MKKVLLLNPPGNNYFIRDYYCSHLSKGRYYWPPLDLLCLSGILKDNFAVTVLDALVENIDYAETRSFIRKLTPDCVISLAAAVSWGSDIKFLSRLKDDGEFLIVVSGDYPLAQPAEVVRDYPFIDAVLLDFTDSQVDRFINREQKNGLKNVYTKYDNGNPAVIIQKSFSLPVPSHELFPLKLYHLPHIFHHPYTTIMTDFGCPFYCTFCPFERIGYKTRDLDSIAKELEYIASLNIKELWLRDQSFGSIRDHALGFCNILKDVKKRFLWSCEMRVDAAEHELLTRMKKCGCHTVMFGVESANEEILNRHKKGTTIRQIENAFRLAKNIGLKTVAHFIFGLAGENLESQGKIMDFCLSLNPDYASFNVANPLWNTQFREEAIKNNWLMDKSIEVDCSCSYPVWETDKLKRSEIWEMRKLALRRFYLRPSYIINRIRNAETIYQYYTLLREGLFFLRNNSPGI